MIKLSYYNYVKLIYMKLDKFILIYFVLVFFVDLSYSQNNYKPGQIGSSIQLNGEDYITGEDGVARMSINIMGHVKYPGTYLVYDEIDLLTCLSFAGGPLKGAKLSNITIISKSGEIIDVNLKKIIKNYNKGDLILKPNDTIYINETLANYLLARSNVINTLLQITNLILISTSN